MAIYGLQTDYMNTILKTYFGLEKPTLTNKPIYVGLGLTQEGAMINTECFTEVFDGKPIGNYRRARAVFGEAVDGVISNLNEISFNTAGEDWTGGSKEVCMVGIFDRLDYQDEDGNMIEPLIVLKLPDSITIKAGETIFLTAGSLNLTLTDE